MLLMASSGFGIAKVASRSAPGSVWHTLARQAEHSTWAGCTLWDVIQPAFMFMVGVALPWSIANRRARGQSSGLLFAHALIRSLVLILLAVFLTSAWSDRTVWVFTNVLAQIGLGYPFLFLLAFTKPRTQWVAAFGILVGYWLAFFLYPIPGPDTDWSRIGIPENWYQITGFTWHWQKNVNLASAFDRWFLNLFPRESPFVFNEGGYQTLNFIPSLATMIFGMLAGRLMRSDRPLRAKLTYLVLAGIAGVAVGVLIHVLGYCPIVKRIWTPSWTIFSAGLVTLLLSAFVAVVEGRGWKRWAFPLVVAGMNPIALYVMWQLMSGFVRDNLKRHFGPHVFDTFGATYAPVMERVDILLVFWLILLLMYRRRIFVRI